MAVDTNAPPVPAVAQTPPVAKLRKRRRWNASTLVLAFPVPILALIFWHMGVTNAWTLPFGIRMAFLPYPYDVARSLVDFAFGGIRNDAFSGELWVNLGASAGRVLTGFAVAAIISIPIGILMGRYGVISKLLDPSVNLLRPIPATAWLPLVALIIGIGDQKTIFLISLSAFFPILLGSISGAKQVPPRLIEAAQMLGTRPAEILFKIVLPAAAPALINGLRVGLGLSWVILVLGESSGTSVGLGATITLARDIVRTDLIVVGMICIGLAGFISDRLLLLIFRLAFRGRPLFE